MSVLQYDSGAVIACRLVAIVAALAVLAGCHDPNERLDMPLRVSEPIAVGNDLLYVHHTFEEVVRLRAERDGEEYDLEQSRADVGPRPWAYALSADESQLFVVNENEQDEDASLSAVDIASQELSSTTIEIDSAYDRLSVDPEGDFLLLSFTGRAGDYIARNLNELGVIDLRDGLQDDESAQFETLTKRARDIVFAPSFEVDGQEQRLAAALSPSQITIVDLLADRDSDDRLREVPLTLSEADRVQEPREAFFVLPEEEDDALRLYVLTDTGEDITEVSLHPSDGEDAERKFDISVNQLAAGNQPVDMELLDSEESGARLAVVDGREPEFTLIDVDSGENATYELPMNAPAEHIAPFEVTVDGEAETRLLTWSTQSDLVAVVRPERIDIDESTPTEGRSVEAIRLESAPCHIELDPDDAVERAVARHGDFESGLTVLDLRDNDAIPIQGAAVNDIHFGPNRAYATFADEDYLGVVDLATGHPTPHRLPEQGRRVHLDREDNLLMVQHADLGGTMTLLDADEPDRENARVFEDVFMTDFLNQEL